MEYFTDIHTHLLSGADDGASDDSEMFYMLDMAYRTGTRRICLTPHFSTEFWGDNRHRGDKSFMVLSEYASSNYPDMCLYPGNEMCFSQNSIDYLNSGKCRTLNGTRHVLVDFHFGASYYEIRSALLDLLGSGYIPVFAHAERYDCIGPPLGPLYELKRFGVIIQLNASSLAGQQGGTLRRRAFKILKEKLADIVASDAHNTTTRNPCLDGAADIIKKRCGEEYAGLLLRTNPDRILGLSKNKQR